jgi:hypothetical protein
MKWSRKSYGKEKKSQEDYEKSGTTSGKDC